MERDDVELIHSVLSGDETAFSALVQKYQKSVHALAWRKIGDFHIAEEITQDTFLQAHKKLRSLKNPNQFAGWLYVIADRCCKAWFRKKKLRTKSLETTSVEALEKTAYADYICEQREDAAVEHRRKIVQKLMEKLPESERTVMVLYYLGEMNCAEISKFLDVSPNTVRSRLQRARERLKDKEHIIHETIEIVDAPVVLDIQSRPNLQDRVGGRNQRENSNDGLSEGTKKVENSITQDPTQWSLPEDAKARLGKGNMVEIQYSPDGKFLAVVSGIGIWLYDVNVHQEASLLTEHTSVITCLTFSPDGRTLASGSSDGIIILWDRSARTQKTLIGHTHWISSLAFSPDGKMIASDGCDGTIRFWDAINGEAKYTLKKESDDVTMLSFTPDGDTIVSWREEKISLLDSITGEHKKTYALHPDCSTTGEAFSPDGKTVAIGSDNGNIYLHDLSTGELKMTFSEHKEHVDHLTFSPDGKTLATSALYDETIRLCLWDIHTGSHRVIYTEHTRFIRGLAFSPDGKSIAIGSGDGTIRFWDTQTGDPKNNQFTGHLQEVYSVALNPNGNYIASGCSTGIIRIWDADTRQPIKTFNESEDKFGLARSIVFSPDGKTLFCGTDDGIQLWDAHTGEHKKILTGHTDPIEEIAISSDGNILASGSWDNTIRLWDAHTGEHKKTLTEHTDSVATIAFSPDDKTLASGSMENSTVRLWDVDTGKTKMILTGHTDPVDAVVFSPDGKILASGSMDNTVRLWDVDTGKTKMILTGHTDWIEAVAFSPDGKTLASGCFDSTINLWDVDTGEKMKTLMGHTSHVKGVEFSPDGKTLVSGSRDGSVLLWEIDP